MIRPLIHSLILLIVPSCLTYQDPACAPGEQTKRDQRCIGRAIDDCDTRKDRKSCYKEWKELCQLEEELYVARCTR